MKALRIVVVCAAALIAPVLAIAGSADRNSAEQITVYYGKLDLSKEADANKLYGQLQVAARQICAPLEGRELGRKAAWKACYTETLANAVLQVNREAVTALHQRNGRGNHAS